MNRRLSKILDEKRKEITALKEKGPLHGKAYKTFPKRDFRGAISRVNQINLIAEIKFASPSAGIIRKDGDPISIGLAYEKAGAAAISLITEKAFFKGNPNHLPQLKEMVSLPILRKDFIIDEMQLKESILLGADAILLIARILSRSKLKDFLDICNESGMAALTEVHDKNDLEAAIECGADIIGINNRDLDSFEVDISTTLKLVPLVPKGKIIVSESGIKDAKTIRLMKKSRVQAFLVGTSLMKSEDIGKKTNELISMET